LSGDLQWKIPRKEILVNRVRLAVAATIAAVSSIALGACNPFDVFGFVKCDVTNGVPSGEAQFQTILTEESWILATNIPLREEVITGKGGKWFKDWTGARTANVKFSRDGNHHFTGITTDGKRIDIDVDLSARSRQSRVEAGVENKSVFGLFIRTPDGSQVKTGANVAVSIAQTTRDGKPGKPYAAISPLITDSSPKDGSFDLFREWIGRSDCSVKTMRIGRS
jgi:hypothetical protein